MYSEPITISYDGENSWSFVRNSVSSNQGLFIETTNSSNPKMTLRVLHSKSGKDKKDPLFAVDRHVFTLVRDELNTDAQRREQASINVTLAVPNSGTVTRTEINQLITAMANFWTTTAHIDKLLRNEV